MVKGIKIQFLRIFFYLQMVLGENIGLANEENLNFAWRETQGCACKCTTGEAAGIDSNILTNGMWARAETPVWAGVEVSGSTGSKSSWEPDGVGCKLLDTVGCIALGNAGVWSPGCDSSLRESFIIFLPLETATLMSDESLGDIGANFRRVLVSG